MRAAGCLFFAAVFVRTGRAEDFRSCPEGPGAATFAIPVRVMSRAADPLDDLRAVNFSVAMDRTELPLCGFGHQRCATSFEILMDTSASMREKGVALAKAAIGRILDESGPGDEYFLAHVGEKVEAADFTTEVPALRPALDRQSAGKTALIDAVYVALNAMRKARHTNRAPVVVSDGDDNQSLFQPAELERAFLLDPVPIFVLWPVDRREPMRMAAIEENSRTIDLAAKSGGGVWRVANLKEMLRAASAVGTLARSPYMLYVDAPSKEGRPKLKVSVKGVRPAPNVVYRGAFGMR